MRLAARDNGFLEYNDLLVQLSGSLLDGDASDHSLGIVVRCHLVSADFVQLPVFARFDLPFYLYPPSVLSRQPFYLLLCDPLLGAQD